MLILSISIFLMMAQSSVRSISFGDPGEVIIWSDLSKGDDQIVNITIPDNCYFGDVDWNYPLGSAFLPYNTEGVNFKLCIEEQWSSDFTRVQELVDGHYRNLSLPTKDTPTCTTSSNGNAALLISAPEGLRYMTAVNYRIILNEEKSAQNEKLAQIKRLN